ncbi:MAG: ABC transporter ATP-binding protein [Oligosphaeraceae bacterium]|nr:ABC transporter ATP-binding protein [Oligosphaeraceae bacterium]
MRARCQEPVIDVQNVCFHYAQQEILHGINLQVYQGDFVILTGPNGGGKTTLIRLILGLLRPGFGKIRVLGHSPRKTSPLLGYVPQSLQFDSAFPANVLDVVLMGRVERSLFGPYRAEDRRIALDCLEQVGLHELAKRHFSALSGGQRQRVLIARALAGQPKLLLLDEPNANLDAAGTQTVHELLRKLNRELTIVMASHNLDTLESYASHVAYVNHTAEMRCLSDMR